MSALLADVENLQFVVALRESTLAYPLVNAAHLIGVALLFGAIVPLDLRLLGWRRQVTAVDPLSRILLPVAMWGFALAAVAGLLLFTTDARAYAASPLFQAKVVLIILALANAWWLRRVDWRGSASAHIRAAAVGSVALWLSVIVLGRLIGYF